MAKTEPRTGRVSGDGTISERPPSPLDAASGADPVASLFSADRTLPAPVVAPEVNESELTRWKAARDSLFGESVKDPPPAGAARKQRTGPLGLANKLGTAPEPPEALAPPQSSASQVRAAPVAKIGLGPETQRTSGAGRRAPVELAPESTGRGDALESEELPKLEPPAPKTRTRAASAPVQPPAAAGTRGEAPPAARGEAPARRPDGTPGKRPAGARQRKPTPAATMRKEQQPERTEPEARGARRFKRGPKPLLLGALALMVLAAGGIAAVILGVVPDPLEDAPIQAPMPPRAAPPKVAAAPPPPAPLSPEAAAAAIAEQAAATAAAAPSAQPAAPTAQAASAAAPAAEIDDGATDSASLLANARKALADDNAAGAEAMARRALARDTDDHHAMEVLARALIDQDRGPEAVALARRIVEKRKKRVPYRLLLGDALLMTGDQAGARKEWEAAAALEPNNKEVQQRLR